MSGTVTSFYIWGNWGTGRLTNLHQLKQLVRGGVRPQGLAPEKKLLAWLPSCCQSCGTKEPSPLKDLPLFFLIFGPNDLAHSWLSRVLSHCRCWSERSPGILSSALCSRRSLSRLLTSGDTHMPLTHAPWFLIQGQYQSQRTCSIILTSQNYLEKGKPSPCFCVRTLISRMLPSVSERPYWTLLGVQFCWVFSGKLLPYMLHNSRIPQSEKLGRAACWLTFLGDLYHTLTD